MEFITEYIANLEIFQDPATNLIVLILFGISELLGSLEVFKSNGVFQAVYKVLKTIVGDVGKPIAVAIYERVILLFSKKK